MFHLIRYTPEILEEFHFDKAEDVFNAMRPDMVNWIDLDTSKDAGELEQLGRLFNIHHLVMEDVVNTRHLPKFEPFEGYYFLTLKMLEYEKHTDTIKHEHLSMILGSNYVITLQENNKVDVFEEVRHRLRQSLGRLRQRKSDYLFYRLLDSVVDKYINIIEHIREHIESMEEYLLGHISDADLLKITRMKRLISEFRKYVLPLHDEVVYIKNDQGTLIGKAIRPYLQDVIDHLTYVNTYFENFREMLRNLMDLHQSQVTKSMNKVMKTLTVVTAIFIPLTFIVGVYGMNFEHMPELRSKWGYPAVWAGMLIIAIGMGIFMKRRKWF